MNLPHRLELWAAWYRESDGHRIANHVIGQFQCLVSELSADAQTENSHFISILVSNRVWVAIANDTVIPMLRGEVGNSPGEYSSFHPMVRDVEGYSPKALPEVGDSSLIRVQLIQPVMPGYVRLELRSPRSQSGWLPLPEK